MTREKAGRANMAFISQLGSLWNTSSLGKNRGNQLEWAVCREQPSCMLGFTSVLNNLPYLVC